MFFIGIITNQKNELYFRKEVSKYVPVENIIFITAKNIYNVKNVKFETIIIDEKINNKIEIRKIISNSTYLLLNADIEIDREIMDNLNLTVITYGFNNKSTFTVSSIEENNMIICLQRVIFNKNGTKIEPQEYQIEIPQNIDKYAVIAFEIFKTIYTKNKANQYLKICA